MGSVFGKIGAETPPYTTVLSTNAYEVRAYPRLLAIEAPCKANGNNHAFGRLAGYIGVMGAAQNKAAQSIAMTAPVVNTHASSMQFILPAAMQSAPPPLSDGVEIVERPPSQWAVATWTGGWNEEDARRRVRELAAAARADGVQVDESDWEYHRFNPPWTLPRFKTNAVAVRVLAIPGPGEGGHGGGGHGGGGHGAADKAAAAPALPWVAKATPA